MRNHETQPIVLFFIVFEMYRGELQYHRKVKDDTINQTTMEIMTPTERDLKSTVEIVQVANRSWLILPPIVSVYKYDLTFSTSILHADM